MALVIYSRHFLCEHQSQLFCSWTKNHSPSFFNHSFPTSPSPHGFPHHSAFWGAPSYPSFLNTCVHFMASLSILSLTGYSTWHHQVQAALLYVPPQPPVQQASFWLMSSPLTQLWSLWIRGSPNSLEDLVPHAKYILYKNRRMGLGERGKVCVWCQEKWEARTLGRLHESRGREERARGRKDCAVLGSEQKDRHVPGNRWRKMVGDLKSSWRARGCWCLGGQMAQSGYHS